MAANQKVGELAKCTIWLAPRHLALASFPSLPVTLCLSRAYPLTTVVFRSLFPCPYLSPEPVAHKLIRSRCLLARDSHWPPWSRRSPCSLHRSLLPACTPRDQDHPFSCSPKVPNIRESYVTERILDE